MTTDQQAPSSRGQTIPLSCSRGRGARGMPADQKGVCHSTGHFKACARGCSWQVSGRRIATAFPMGGLHSPPFPEYPFHQTIHHAHLVHLGSHHFCCWNVMNHLPLPFFLFKLCVLCGTPICFMRPLKGYFIRMQVGQWERIRPFLKAPPPPHGVLPSPSPHPPPTSASENFSGKSWNFIQAYEYPTQTAAGGKWGKLEGNGGGGMALWAQRTSR